MTRKDYVALAAALKGDAAHLRGPYTNPKLAERLFSAVMDAMQNAEEIGGPNLPDYIRLMARIAREANERIERATAVHGYHGELADWGQQ